MLAALFVCRVIGAVGIDVPVTSLQRVLLDDANEYRVTHAFLINAASGKVPVHDPLSNLHEVFLFNDCLNIDRVFLIGLC